MVNFLSLARKIIQTSFLVQVFWQKESVSPLIFQQISELEVRTNLVVHYEANYQQLYHTFVDFCSSWNRTESFLELLYHKFVESSINEEHSIL